MAIRCNSLIKALFLYYCTITLYLVILVMFARIQQQSMHRPGTLPLLTKNILILNYWRLVELPISTNLVENNAPSTYLHQFTAPTHQQQDAF